MVKNNVIEYLKKLNKDLEERRSSPAEQPELIYGAGLGGKVPLHQMPNIDEIFDELESEGFWDKYK